MQKLLFCLIIFSILLPNIYAEDLKNDPEFHENENSSTSLIPLNFNNLSLDLSLNQSLSGYSYAFGSLVEYEKKEMSESGISNKLNYSVYKTRISYDRILLGYGNNYYGIKSNGGYSFIVQDNSFKNRSLLMKYQYFMFGPEVTIPLGAVENTIAVSAYYQFGIIRNGKYKPLASVSGENNYFTESTKFNGSINNFGVSLNLYTEIVSSKIYLDFTNYNFKFDDLDYKYQGRVPRAYINEFCFGLTLGINY